MLLLALPLLLASAAEESKDDLETAESQSYGFGYGTKVQDKYSVATGKTKLTFALKTVKKAGFSFSLRSWLRH